MPVLSGKELKKWRKIKLKLEKDNLSLSSVETCHVAIANGGLGNGVSANDLLAKVKEFGSPEKYVSAPKKSYAEFTFPTSEDAANVVGNLQGCQINKSCENSTATLYLYYLATLSDSGEADAKKSGFPDGLFLFEEFVTEGEEKELLAEVLAFSGETLKHRTVFHFGHEFRYGTNDVDLSTPAQPLPAFCDVIISRMLATGHMSERPDQLTVNVYEPGEGIPLHTDNVVAFGGCLATLSLGSAVVMELRSEVGERAEVLLRRRTLSLFTGEARYRWSHGIRQRKTDLVEGAMLGNTAGLEDGNTARSEGGNTARSEGGNTARSEGGNTAHLKGENPVLLQRGRRVSLTFRKVARGLPRSREEAEALEERHVHRVYSDIADHFSSTRGKPWPNVARFLAGLDPGSLVLDVGCGSGRYLGVSPGVVCVGCDRSLPLLELCSRGKNPRGVSHASFACDGRNLPVRSGGFDACICIAVVHHFSTNQRRAAAVAELLRVVATGGSVLVYVWAVEQRFNDTDSKYLKKSSRSEDKLPKEIEDKLPNKTDKIEDKLQNESEDKLLNESSKDKLPKEPHEIEDKLPEEPESEDKLPKKNYENEDKLPNEPHEIGDKTPNEIEDKPPESIAVHTNGTPFSQQDLFVPWKKKEKNSTFLRFYHVFKEGELEGICRGIPGCEIVRSYHDNGNWAVVLKKI